MSKLSDTWHNIRSGFDINKMKRDPWGSIAKLTAIYGLGSTLYGAIDPTGAASTAKWMRGGFGLYDDTPTSKQGSGYKGKEQWAYRGGDRGTGKPSSPTYNLKGYADYKDPKAGRGFLERQVRSVGGFFASPFEFGRDLNEWYNGEKGWDQIYKDNFGWMEGKKDFLENMSLLSGRGGGGGGRPRPTNDRTSRIRSGMRDFTAPTANISSPGQTSAYRQGGVSQALIAGSINPQTLAMIRYGSGNVQGAQARNINLSSVEGIKTSLSRTLPTTVAV
jgi:hypothetical protein